MAFISLQQWLATMIAVLLARTFIGAIRRLFFHPLAHIPGPRLAALTWWYEFYYDCIEDSKFVFRIQELHEQYGPIIRITPDELHCNDVGFLDTIYSSSPRDKYGYQLKTLRVPGSIGAAQSHEVHKKRREALTPFFTRRNILSLQPVITRKVDQLCQLIGKHADEKTPINLTDVLFGCCNDIVNNFLFAHQTDVLADETKAAQLRENAWELLKGININKHFPWIPDFLESLPLSISRPMMPPGLLDMMALFERVRAELITIMDATATSSPSTKFPGPTGKESVYASVLSSPILPPAEKSLLRLEQEGALLVLAGTESPARTLVMILFHLISNPPLLAKLRAELSTLPKEATWTELEKLPYLGAVIEEGNRLSWGVTARTARIAHEPLTYTPSPHSPSPGGKSYTIPPGTPISTTTLSVHTSPSIFPDPYTFNPDRWLGDAGRERRKFQMAFSKGSRKCLGVELAKAELFLVVARLVEGFEMELWETGESEVEFVRDYQVAMPGVGAKGVRVIAKRR